jgi:hypothetical protein
MSFGSALGYPFKSGNIPKVLTIILSFLIIVASLVVIGMLFRSSNASNGLGLVSNLIGSAYGLFVSGYMISVIRSVMDGDELLPPVSLGRDLTRGLACMIAGFIYAIPFIIVFACLFATVLSASVGSMDVNNIDSIRRSSDNINPLMLCGGGLLMLFLSFAVGMSYIVGMVRYAAEDSASALFNFPANFGTVMSNFGTALGLFFRQFGLGIVYGILAMIILFGAAGSVTAMVSDPNASLPLVLVVAIGAYIVFLSLMLMSQLSSAHLYAGFANEIGIGNRKSKNDGF